MKLYQNFVISLFCLIISLSGNSQTLSEFPVISSDFGSNLLIFQPSHIGILDSSLHHLSISYEGRTGIQKNIRNNFLSFETRSNKNKGHHFGVFFIRNQSSNFISRNRLLLNYKYKLPLSTYQSLILGSSVGLFNFFIRDNPSGVSGSSTVPDANIGLSYINRSFKIGASFNQFLNNELKPIRNFILLAPYFSFYSTYKTVIGLNSDLEFKALYNLLTGQDLYNVEISYTYLNKLSFGLIYRNFRGFSSLLKIKNLNIRNHRLDIHISNSLVGANLPGLEYQINLLYHMGHLSKKNQ